jgi:hypothetical protein
MLGSFILKIKEKQFITVKCDVILAKIFSQHSGKNIEID